MPYIAFGYLPEFKGLHGFPLNPYEGLVGPVGPYGGHFNPSKGLDRAHGGGHMNLLKDLDADP